MEAYLGTKMYIEAVKKAGSFDTDKVIKAFEGLSYTGPVGNMTMRKEDHQNQTPAVVGVVKGKTKYYPFAYPTPEMVLPAKDVSLTLEESGWKPYKGK